MSAHEVPVPPAFDAGAEPAGRPPSGGTWTRARAADRSAARPSATQAGDVAFGRSVRSVRFLAERARVAIYRARVAQASRRRTQVDVTDEHGQRVRFLLRRSGAAVEVVAIVPPGSLERVTEALTSARIALRAHGIALTHGTRTRATPSEEEG
ncbi:MAG: hypothetical protein ACREM6_12015 [Vulcanimicrobiaceae bacterium]